MDILDLVISDEEGSGGFETDTRLRENHRRTFPIEDENEREELKKRVLYRPTTFA
jgi:hypothetical protein